MASLSKQLIQNTPLIEHWIAKSNCWEIDYWMIRKYTNDICKSCLKSKFTRFFFWKVKHGSPSFIKLFTNPFPSSTSSDFVKHTRFLSFMLVHGGSIRQRLWIYNINITSIFSKLNIMAYAIYSKRRNGIYLNLMSLVFHW